MAAIMGRQRGVAAVSAGASAGASAGGAGAGRGAAAGAALLGVATLAEIDELAPAAAGTATTLPQAHLAFLPASFSGALSFAPHLGHFTEIDISRSNTLYLGKLASPETSSIFVTTPSGLKLI